MKQTALKPARKKACKVCQEKFTPPNTLARTCSIKCAIIDGESAKKESIKTEKKENRKALREYKANNKTYNQLIKEAWAPCSKFIRLVRDINEPCISCGRYDHEITEPLTGGKFDAGHYLGKAAHPELRFHPDNIHKQCKTCNGGAGKYAKKNHTVTQSYRVNLIEKIGVDRVNYLEGHHQAQNWTHDDLKDIAKHYKESSKL